MGVSKALAQPLDRRQLFTSTMARAKELTEVSRSISPLARPQP